MFKVFPGDLLESTYPDPSNPDIVLARSEVERRGQYIEQLVKVLPDGEHHPLTQMVKQCLQNAPTRRPTAEEIVAELCRVRVYTEDSCGATVYIPRSEAVKQVVTMKEMLVWKAEVSCTIGQ